MRSLRRTRFTEGLWWLHRVVWRASRCRLGASYRGMRTLELIATGRRSGQPRSVLLFFLGGGSRYLVVGSHLGEDRHPPWWLNLAAEPRALVRTAAGTVAVAATELTGRERDEWWARFVAAYPDYGFYQGRTERVIPVVALDVVEG